MSQKETQMKIVIKGEGELLEIAKELCHILTNLRYFTTEWQLHHGYTLLEQKKKWEKRADDFIAKLKTTRSAHKYDVHIKLENNDNVGTKD